MGPDLDRNGNQMELEFKFLGIEELSGSEGNLTGGALSSDGGRVVC